MTTLVFFTYFLLFCCPEYESLFFERIELSAEEKAAIEAKSSFLASFRTKSESLCANQVIRLFSLEHRKNAIFWTDRGQGTCNLRMIPDENIDALTRSSNGSESVYVMGYRQCPLSHPFTIGNEQFCCASKTKNFVGQCDGTQISPQDPVECCPFNNITTCSSHGFMCRSVLNATDKILLARQDISDGVKRVFDTSNYLDMNKENTSALMYSRMFQLEQFRGLDGKFHFKLCYPRLTDTFAPDSCFEFKQTSNPFEITTRTQSVEGFELIQDLYSESYRREFVGLRSDSNHYAFLDGNVGLSWWSCILLRKFFGAKQMIPAVKFSDKSVVLTDSAELYVIF